MKNDIRDLSRYNAEGSLLRRDQLELLRMLKIVAGICKENNIQWWLSSGTLLGAARHKGFIPWDDDMDIVLLRKDYKRLEKILCTMENEDFVFHCMKTDVDYVNEYGKFRKKEGRVQSKNHRYAYYKWVGVGFDIFSIEKTNRCSAFIAQGIYSKLQSMTYHIDADIIRKPLIRLIEFICHLIVFPLLRVIGLINPRQEYHYSLGTGWYNHTFYMKDTFPLSLAEFEGEMMPVPNNMDVYLTNVYGDWRTLPSDEDINKSIHCQEYRDEIFGEQK